MSMFFRWNEERPEPDIIYCWCDYDGMRYDDFIKEYLPDFILADLVSLCGDDQVIVHYNSLNKNKRLESNRIIITGKYYNKAKEVYDMYMLLKEAERKAHIEAWDKLGEKSSAGLNALLNNIKKEDKDAN